MMIQENCYSKFKQKSEFLTTYFEVYKHRFNYNIEYGWELHSVPLELVLKEPLLKSVDSKYKILRCGILRMTPNRCYNWHVDRFRGVAINMLLTPENHSHCHFAEIGEDIIHFNHIELKYTKNDFYLFNTQQNHFIINYDEPRYLLTIEFEQDKNSLSYHQLKDWATSKGLI